MVNNSTNINKTNNNISPKRSLNSDCQQFYQYQQKNNKKKKKKPQTDTRNKLIKIKTIQIIKNQ